MAPGTRPSRAARRGGVVLAAALLSLTWAPGGGDEAAAAPKPKRSTASYNLDILGFNDGEPYRLRGAQAEAVLAEQGCVVFRFTTADWMAKDQSGSHVPVREITARYPHRPTSELIGVYRVDLDQDEVPEMLLVVDSKRLGDGRRYAPTLLTLGERGYEPLWSSQNLAGERHQVVDIRDLNADGRPEILLAGVAGRSGYYQFHEVLGRGPDGVVALPVRHVDSIHYVDLDVDGLIEIVVRERVGRRGPAYQWTYIDHLHQWDGRRFVGADVRYPRYHDEETLPTLVGDLIDHYDAKLPILEEKVEAIERVRAEVLDTVPKPRGYGRSVVRALAHLYKNQRVLARKRLEDLDRAYAYHLPVLLGLAQLHASAGRWSMVLDHAIRALTVDPRERQGWWWLGVALTHLEERSSAVASFHNLVRICGSPEEGLAFLKARRSEAEGKSSLQRAIDQAVEDLGP